MFITPSDPASNPPQSHVALDTASIPPRSHAALDAASMKTFRRRWIPGSSPKMTGKEMSCRTRCGIHGEKQESPWRASLARG
ncbi:hypothetical protein OO185_02990 [Prosthecochloris sp. SCSIO W1102]|uniref:hypothetical protein n=1 Tax=Prosthecochloris sp. SCSIO W1102 TaxID=2992243 RepID=UPI00223DC103|nr:hypothetical protein [Prosthecochloris sp. SCSIO W1102]UZJ40083.1 hypothetical protein OO185_02990 [Prosthecochloris sp. SCSIO W1102]